MPWSPRELDVDPAAWPSAPRFGRGGAAGPLRQRPRAVEPGPPAAREGEAPVRSVLFVCTGNVCRSPVAERLLALRAPHLRARSRGTFALVGSPIDPDMTAELAARGGDGTGFRSTQLEPIDLDADLVLAMSPEHVARVRDERPDAARRTGLLGHVGALAAQVEEGQVLDAATVASWARARPGGDGSIEDPFRRGRAVAARTAARIDEQVALLARVLTAPEVR